MATKVTLREKPISKGRQSLYLDFYPPIPHAETGLPTRREFLNMYLFEKPKNPIEKQHNSETRRIAEQIWQQKQNTLSKPEIYDQFEKEQLRIRGLAERDFVEFFTKIGKKKKGSTFGVWDSARIYLEKFTGGSLKFGEITEGWLESFKDHLIGANTNRSKFKPLAPNSAVAYFDKVKTALKLAYKEGLLQTDLNSKVTPIKSTETKREYLTVEELNRLAKTPCRDEMLKKAALFSALTGLRFSDIEKLTWREVQSTQGKFSLQFRQQKTKGQEVLPISEQAFRLLGERGELDEKVFQGLHYSAWGNRHIAQWIGTAGITKDITFHNFRHTYATLQLSYGTDIYTVSKLLGHKDLKTTQIYAKVIDQSKQDAAERIQIEFPIETM